jgi:hypothetical protein
MMENRKKVGLIIIGSAIILLAVAIFFLLQLRQKPAANTGIVSSTTGSVTSSSGATTITPTTTPGDRVRNYQIYNIAKESPHQLNSNDAINLSSSFAERFGSFSNQSNYDNFADARLFMTTKMQAWLDNYLTGLRAQNYNGVFYSITTKALTTAVQKYDDKAGTATVLVRTQRQETKATTTKVFLQNISLNLIRSNKEWKIDGAFWAK